MPEQSCSASWERSSCAPCGQFPSNTTATRPRMPRPHPRGVLRWESRFACNDFFDRSRNRPVSAKPRGRPASDSDHLAGKDGGLGIGLAENAGIAERLDVLDIEQFLVLDLDEWRRFGTANRRSTRMVLCPDKTTSWMKWRPVPASGSPWVWMADLPEVRSRTMRAVKSRDTGAEMMVRRRVHSPGYRYCTDGPCPARRTWRFPAAAPRYSFMAVSGTGTVAGAARIPKTRRGYWAPKLRKNQERDRRHRNHLREMGWRVPVVREWLSGSARFATSPPWCGGSARTSGFPRDLSTHASGRVSEWGPALARFGRGLVQTSP